MRLKMGAYRARLTRLSALARREPSLLYDDFTATRLRGSYVYLFRGAGCNAHEPVSDPHEVSPAERLFFHKLDGRARQQALLFEVAQERSVLISNPANG